MLYFQEAFYCKSIQYMQLCVYGRKVFMMYVDLRDLEQGQYGGARALRQQHTPNGVYSYLIYPVYNQTKLITY